MQLSTPLGELLEKLNSIVLICNLDVKIHDEDVVLILHVSLLFSFENFVEYFVVGNTH